MGMTRFGPSEIRKHPASSRAQGNIVSRICRRSGVQTVVVMKAQLGASEFLLNVLGYHLDLAPSPILEVQPSIEMEGRFSRQRPGPRCST
jgi:phage terminase large subunit GpA-like protein